MRVLALGMVCLASVLVAACATPKREMTRDEIGAVHKASGPYLRCVKEKALATSSGSDDVKLIVDTAMYNCDDNLSAVRQKLAEFGQTDEVYVSSWLRMLKRDISGWVTEDVLKAKARSKS